MYVTVVINMQLLVYINIALVNMKLAFTNAIISFRKFLSHNVERLQSQYD